MAAQAHGLGMQAHLLKVGRVISIPAFSDSHVRIRHFFGTRPTGSRAVVGAMEHGPLGGGHSLRRDHGSNGRVRGRPTRPITVVSIKQVHGTDVLVLDRAVDPRRVFSGEGDALVTNQPHVLLTVRTADCLPLLMYDPVGQVVAAVHAGWRGALAGILPRTLKLMRRRFGSVMQSVRLGIGPSVGPCCYEVDAPVLKRLRADFPDWQSVSRKTGPERAMLDLRELVRGQARLMGVQDNNIFTVRVCTVCHPRLFYSYRREGRVNGTMVSGIMLTRRGQG